MSRILTVYFSPTGTTAAAAKDIAAAVGSELYEIVPETPYTAADLDWRDKNSRSTLEMDDPASRPAIAGAIPDMDAYDMVFLGFPIWWYVEPRIVDTFLDAAGLDGKAVVPFATSGSSGIANVERNLRERYPRVNWQPGKRVASGAGKWAKGLVK